MILDLFGYDRHGEVTECKTTLQKNALNTSLRSATHATLPVYGPVAPSAGPAPAPGAPR